MINTRTKAKDKFCIGDRVKLSPIGIRRKLVLPKHSGRKGTVIGFSRGVFSVRVLWDGLKTPQQYYVGFISQEAKNEPR